MAEVWRELRGFALMRLRDAAPTDSIGPTLGAEYPEEGSMVCKVVEKRGISTAKPYGTAVMGSNLLILQIVQPTWAMGCSCICRNRVTT
jgi:hypothetical protein